MTRLAAVLALVAVIAAAQTPKGSKNKAPGMRMRLAQSTAAASKLPATPPAAPEPVAARIPRSLMAQMEQATDRKFETTMDEDPFSIIGLTRGVYLDGYGVVFTTEVDLAPSAAPNPFRPAYGRGELMLLKEKKKYRIIKLKEGMKEMLYTFAQKLDPVRTEDIIAIAVTVPYYRWETSEGMPKQIVMSASRKTILDAKAGSLAAVAALKIVEQF